MVPNLALVPEVEGGEKVIVRLLESEDLEPLDVIYAVKFGRGSRPGWQFGHRLRQFSR